MKTIFIRAGSAHYEALVGRGLLPEAGARAVAAGLRGPRCAVVADEKTAPLFAGKVLASFREAGFAPVLLTIPAGEGAKSLERLGAVCDQMTAAGLDRSSFVVALGGGVVGDLAGFAAAIYHRGIPHVQIPTTLLAQVDSAIGGKTAVNTTAGKNLLGAIHQPALVLVDIATLETLPAREFKQGFAEVIKHAVIADASLFELLKVAQASSLQRSEDASWKLALPNLIARNIEIKAAIVERDEQDVSGERAILNFGHTVGHAIEQTAGYGTFLHGEAISLGLVVACEISVRKAGLAESERRKVVAALEAFALPTRLPVGFPRARILAAMQADKKIEGGAMRFVVAPRLGAGRLVTNVTLEDIAASIEHL